MKELFIKKVAVLGAGVMGAQIAAHFANAQIPVVLFDLKSEQGAANQILDKALANLQKLTPAPLATEKSLAYITIANYTDHLELLRECDFIIEAIAERLDLKQSLYSKVSGFVHGDAIFASNTSGIGIATLAESLPQELRSHFCGVHFFNPPRYMSLVELTPHKTTDLSILPQLETFLVTSLGKTVILAKDTPNFIANRLGIFSMLSTSMHATRMNIPFEVVDELTGKDLGRAKSATFRTVDVVGLDTFAHVVKTMIDHCKNDGFGEYYVLPSWMEKLIAAGQLGAKTKAGIFTKDKDGIKVIDLETFAYRVASNTADKEVVAILKGKNWSDKFAALRASQALEAKFLLACFVDIFHYAAVLLGEIADTPREMDFAMRCGFGWKEGIFEIWQQAGWTQIANYVQAEIDAGHTIAKTPLPAWVFELKDGIYVDNKYFDIKTHAFVERKQLPVYARQLFPELLLNETVNVPCEVLYENSGVKLWHTGDHVGILSFKSKMCAIGSDVLAGIDVAIDIAEEKCTSMVIWQEKDIFSAGANLEEFGSAIMRDGVAGIDKIIATGHRIIAQKIRYSRIPVIAAVRGYALGGGCELMLHCDGVVAALESYIGLVEPAVGLIPGWGGTTEMAYRASLADDPWRDFERRYKNIARAKVSASARDALELGYLRESDIIVMNSREVLAVAKVRAQFMAYAGYRPPLLPTKIKVFGEQGIANVQGMLVNMLAGQQISEHDMLIAKTLAYVMSGSELEKNSEVSQDWLLNMEKEKFKELALNPKSMARIEHMLKTGKPLRN